MIKEDPSDDKKEIFLRGAISRTAGAGYDIERTPASHGRVLSLHRLEVCHGAASGLLGLQTAVDYSLGKENNHMGKLPILPHTPHSSVQTLLQGYVF